MPVSDRPATRCPQCMSVLARRQDGSRLLLCPHCGSAVELAVGGEEPRIVGKQGAGAANRSQLPVGRFAELAPPVGRAHLAGVLALRGGGPQAGRLQLGWLVGEEGDFLLVQERAHADLFRLEAGAGPSDAAAEGSVSFEVEGMWGEVPWVAPPGCRIRLCLPQPDGSGGAARLAWLGPESGEPWASLTAAAEMTPAQLSYAFGEPASGEPRGELPLIGRPRVPAEAAEADEEIVETFRLPVSTLVKGTLYFAVFEVVAFPFVYPERHDLAALVILVELICGAAATLLIHILRCGLLGGLVSGALVFGALSGLFSALIQQTSLAFDFRMVALPFVGTCIVIGAVGGLLVGSAREQATSLR